MEKYQKINGSYNRIGFHYYPDSKHYSDKDLKTWIPILKSINAYWLVLPVSFNRAIPESFLKGLINQNITPIIHLHQDFVPGMDSSQLEPLIHAYARWGVKYIILFDRPNRKTFYSQAPSKSNPVQYFIENFVPLANMCLRHGIKPVLSPLEPGGDYWDLTFLEAALGSIYEQDQDLANSLTISAFAWMNNHDTDWGKGGAHNWPGTRPYFTPENHQDHQGFRIFEWYNEISQAIIHRSANIILLGLGIPAIPASNTPDIQSYKQPETCLQIGKMLSNKFPQTEKDQNKIDLVPDYVLCGNFWTLAEKSTRENPFAWVNPEGNTETLSAWIAWIKENETALKTSHRPTPSGMRKPAHFPHYSTNDPKYILSLMEKQEYQAVADEEINQKTVIQTPEKMVQSTDDLERELQDNGFTVDTLSFETLDADLPEESREINDESFDETAKPVEEVLITNEVLSPSESEQTATENEKIELVKPVEVGFDNSSESLKSFSPPIEHYLLLPSYEWGVADYHLDMIRPILKKQKPTLGFSLKEAALAKRITVVGTHQVYPDEILEKLKANGAKVERIYDIGTHVASKRSKE